MLIAADWLARPAPEVAPELVGCTLVRRMPTGTLIRGLIVETEAYTQDQGCSFLIWPDEIERIMD